MAITTRPPISAIAPAREVLVPATTAESDGSIWHWELNPGRIVEQPVRLIRARERKNPRLDGRRLPVWMEHFLDTAELLAAKSDAELRKMVTQHAGEMALAFDYGLYEQLIREPQSYICAQLASGLSGALFVVWWRKRERRLDIGVFCPNERCAGYASLLAKGVNPFPVGKCIECGSRFLRAKTGPQGYCGKRCRNTHNVRATRQRQRQRERKRQTSRRKRRAGKTKGRAS
jgi:hypothetical protein